MPLFVVTTQKYNYNINFTGIIKVGEYKRIKELFMVYILP